MSVSDADRAKADELHEAARALEDEPALEMYQQVLALDPERPTTHYNIGLIYKYQGRWQESFSHNQRAVSLDPDSEAANWNLAIAATALRDWRTARDVWNRLGMNIEPGDTAIESDFGVTPVRLNPDDSGEVVWGRRIDPVRVRIESVPWASSGYRYADIVLHDGAAVGYRTVEDREYPVFNVLELFEHSQLSTFEAEVRAASPTDIEELIAAFDRTEIPHENWTTSVRVICRQCSEGRPHEHHDEERKNEWPDRHVFGVAAMGRELAESVLLQWAGGRRLIGRRRKVLRFELKLAPPLRH